MTTSSSFKKLFKDGKDASKGQETPNEHSYKDRILEVVKAIKEEMKDASPEQLNSMAVEIVIKDEIEKIMKDVKNSGFHTLDTVRDMVGEK